MRAKYSYPEGKGNMTIGAHGEDLETDSGCLGKMRGTVITFHQVHPYKIWTSPGGLNDNVSRK